MEIKIRRRKKKIKILGEKKEQKNLSLDKTCSDFPQFYVDSVLIEIHMDDVKTYKINTDYRLMMD